MTNASDHFGTLPSCVTASSRWTSTADRRASICRHVAVSGKARHGTVPFAAVHHYALRASQAVTFLVSARDRKQCQAPNGGLRVNRRKHVGVSLSKGGNVSLTKEAPGLTAVIVGLGWDVRTTTGADFDLDASALLCNAAGKVASRRALRLLQQPQEPGRLGRAHRRQPDR